MNKERIKEMHEKLAPYRNGIAYTSFRESPDNHLTEMGLCVKYAYELLDSLMLPNDQGERQPPEQQNQADKPQLIKNQNLAAVRSTALLDGSSEIKRWINKDGRPMVTVNNWTRHDDLSEKAYSVNFWFLRLLSQLQQWLSLGISQKIHQTQQAQNYRWG